MLQRLFHKIFLTIFGIFIFFSGSANAAETAQSFTFTSAHNPQIKAVFPVNPNKIEKQIHLPSTDQSPRGIKALLLSPQYGPITTRQQGQELIVDTLKEKFIYTQEHDEKAVLLKEWIEALEPNTTDGSTYIWQLSALNPQDTLSLKKKGRGVEIFLSDLVIPERNPTVIPERFSRGSQPLDPRLKHSGATVATINPIIYFDKNNHQYSGTITINSNDNTIAIHVKASKDQYPLRIDPTLRYGQWLGSSGGETTSTDIAYNTGNGTIKLAGYVSPVGNLDIPVAMNGVYNGGTEGFVVSILDGGTPSLIWGQYLGGSSTDFINTMAIDGSNIYVSGRSGASTQWTTLTFQGVYNGGSEVFVIKLTDGGTPTINWGQWLGGNGNEGDAALDINGASIYVGAESTASTNWTTLTFQGTFNGTTDILLIKITDGGTPTINWGQWIGGSSTDNMNTVVVNGSSIYIGGSSDVSTQWTTLTFQGTHNGTNASDAFVIKLTDGGTPTINWGQWIGGTGLDRVNSLFVTGSAIYVGGSTGSSTNWTTLTFQGTYNGAAEGFVLKIIDGGTPTINWGQWIGGNQSQSAPGRGDRIVRISVNGSDIYAFGASAQSTNFTTLTFAGNHSGSTEGFVIKLTDGGTPTIKWGQWVGGAASDTISDMVLNGSDIYISGITLNSQDYETVTFQGTFSGDNETYIIKISDGGTPTLNWGQWIGGGDIADAEVNDIAVWGAGIFLGGYISNANLTETITFQGSHNGFSEGFVIKLNDSAVPSLVWGQWVGGAGEDRIIAIDVNDTKIFASGTAPQSTNFTTMTFQGTHNGSSEIFVVKMTDGGTPSVNWGQWVGGSGFDIVNTLVVNGASIYIGGISQSSTKFTTLTFQGTHNGGSGTAGFVIKLTDGGTPTINWGQWLGGNASTLVQDVAIKGTNIYVGGASSASTNWTTLTFQGTHNGASQAFVIKMTDGGTPTINWGQWLGGGADDKIFSVAANNLYLFVGGYSNGNASFTTMTFYGTFNSVADSFVIKLTDGGTPTINWGQWLGGVGSDQIYSLKLNGLAIYAAGASTTSTNFTTLTFQGTNNSSSEGFLIKLTDGGSPTINWGQWLGGDGTQTLNAIAVNGTKVYVGGMTTLSTAWETVTFQGSHRSVSEAYVVSISDPSTAPTQTDTMFYDNSF